MIANADIYVPQTRLCEQCQCEFSFVVPSGTHEGSLRRVCDNCKNGRKPRECRWCKETYFKAPGNGSLSKYCCEDHRDLYYAYLSSERYKRKTEAIEAKSKACEDCGTTYLSKHGLQKYCDECAIKLKGIRKKQCMDCGEVFRGTMSKRCKECRIKREQERIVTVRQERVKRATAGATEIGWTLSVGTSGEMVFDLLCARMRWHALRSIYETNPGYDRVIYLNGLFRRVQIKAVASSRKEQGKAWAIIRGERPVTKEQCDMVGIVDVDTGDVWLIDIEQMPERIHPTELEHARYNALGL